MADLTKTVAKIEASKQNLADAVAASGNADYANLFAAVDAALSPVLADPGTPISQGDADTIGATLRDLEAELETGSDGHLVLLAEHLHAVVSQACVNHQPQIDWHQAAAVAPPVDGTEMEAGVKHKPAAE